MGAGARGERGCTWGAEPRGRNGRCAGSGARVAWGQQCGGATDPWRGSMAATDGSRSLGRDAAGKVVKRGEQWSLEGVGDGCCQRRVACEVRERRSERFGAKVSAAMRAGGSARWQQSDERARCEPRVVGAGADVLVRLDVRTRARALAWRSAG